MLWQQPVPPPPNTPNCPTWTPPPTDPPGAPPPIAPPRPPLQCPPPPPPRGLRPTVSWGGSWRPEPRGRPPRAPVVLHVFYAPPPSPGPSYNDSGSSSGTSWGASRMCSAAVVPTRVAGFLLPPVCWGIAAVKPRFCSKTAARIRVYLTKDVACVRVYLIRVYLLL